MLFHALQTYSTLCISSYSQLRHTPKWLWKNSTKIIQRASSPDNHRSKKTHPKTSIFRKRLPSKISWYYNSFCHTSPVNWTPDGWGARLFLGEKSFSMHLLANSLLCKIQMINKLNNRTHNYTIQYYVDCYFFDLIKTGWVIPENKCECVSRGHCVGDC